MPGQPDRTGIEPGFHLHDAHARRRVAGFDRSMDGGGTAPAGQQGGMNVQAAKARQFKQTDWQNESIGSHNQGIWFDSLQVMPSGRIFQLEGLIHRNAMTERHLLDGAHLNFLASSCRPVRLSEH